MDCIYPAARADEDECWLQTHFRLPVETKVFPGLAKLWSQHRPPPPKPPVHVNCTLQANHCVWTIADGLVSGWCQNEGADASRTAAGIRVGTLLRPLSRVDSRGSPYSFSSDAVNVTDIIRLCTRRLAVLSSKG